MRILKFLFSASVIFVVLAVVGWLSTREVLLFIATNTVKSSLTELQSISLNYGNYVRTCREKGAPGDQVAVTGLQLRFLSSNEYVLELICNTFQYDPLVIERKSLPPFVMKEPGSGGVVWGSELSAIVLNIWGRKQALGVQEKAVTTFRKLDATGISPQTTCSGRGFVCCMSDTQFGTGQLQSQVSDCPKSCFSTCLPRPVVLSFTADPPADQATRQVSIRANQTVSFAYVISYEKAQLPTVQIDFGDGKTESFSTLSGKTAHLYTCNLGTCNYQVHLTVQTAEQVSSVTTELSQMTVQVSP